MREAGKATTEWPWSPAGRLGAECARAHAAARKSPLPTPAPIATSPPPMAHLPAPRAAHLRACRLRTKFGRSSSNASQSYPNLVAFNEELATPSTNQAGPNSGRIEPKWIEANQRLAKSKQDRIRPKVARIEQSLVGKSVAPSPKLVETGLCSSIRTYGPIGSRHGPDTSPGGRSPSQRLRMRPHERNGTELDPQCSQARHRLHAWGERRDARKRDGFGETRLNTGRACGTRDGEEAHAHYTVVVASRPPLPRQDLG